VANPAGGVSQCQGSRLAYGTGRARRRRIRDITGRFWFKGVPIIVFWARIVHDGGLNAFGGAQTRSTSSASRAPVGVHCVALFGDACTAVADVAVVGLFHPTVCAFCPTAIGGRVDLRSAIPAILATRFTIYLSLERLGSPEPVHGDIERFFVGVTGRDCRGRYSLTLSNQVTVVSTGCGGLGLSCQAGGFAPRQIRVTASDVGLYSKGIEIKHSSGSVSNVVSRRGRLLSAGGNDMPIALVLTGSVPISGAPACEQFRIDHLGEPIRFTSRWRT